MKDIKVLDTLKEIEESEKWWNEKHSPVEFFAESVSMTRNEGTGVSIEDISKCFKYQFSLEELKALIHQLSI